MFEAVLYVGVVQPGGQPAFMFKSSREVKVGQTITVLVKTVNNTGGDVSDIARLLAVVNSTCDYRCFDVSIGESCSSFGQGCEHGIVE